MSFVCDATGSILQIVVACLYKHVIIVHLPRWYFVDSMLCPEDEELIKDCLISDDRLMLKEPCSSFYDQDYYVEKIKELHLYVDMVWNQYIFFFIFFYF